MKKLLAVVAVMIVAATLQARAATGLTIAAADLQDQNAAAVSTDTLVILVLDVNNDGFSAVDANSSLTPGDLFNAGGDDRVLFAVDCSLNATPGVLQGSTTVLYNDEAGPAYINKAGGQQVEMIWFPGLTLSATTVGAFEWYGTYTDATGANSGSDPWKLPGTTVGTLTLNAFTIDNVAGATPNDLPDNTLKATLETVPEPSTLTLVGLGLLGVFAVRRHR